jgi:hypothetical protein
MVLESPEGVQSLGPVGPGPRSMTGPESVVHVVDAHGARKNLFVTVLVALADPGL